MTDYLALYTDDQTHTLIVGWDGAAWTGLWAAKAESARLVHPTPDTYAAITDTFKLLLDLAVEQGLCRPPIDTSDWENW